MRLKTNTILITGSSGFIGKSILRSILKLKKYNPVCLLNKRKIKIKGKYKIITKKRLFQTIEKIDYIIHSAGLDEFNVKNEREITRKNSEMDNFIKTVVIKYRVKKLIFLSSNRVYENFKKNLITENSKTAVTTIYAKSKLRSEMAFKKLNTSLVILRLPSVISKNFSKGLIFRVIRDLKQNKRINIYNSQSKFNNIIFINDLTRAIIELLKKIIINSKIINLSSNKSEKFINVINFLKLKLESRSKFNIIKSKRVSHHYSNTLQKKFFRTNFLSVKSALRFLL